MQLRVTILVDNKEPHKGSVFEQFKNLSGDKEAQAELLLNAGYIKKGLSTKQKDYPAAETGEPGSHCISQCIG